jgi:hypothetical protein
MNTYFVDLGGYAKYTVEASSIGTAIKRGITAYLQGVDIQNETEERKAYFCKNRRKYLNRKNDINRQDEGSFNIIVRVKRIA